MYCLYSSMELSASKPSWCPSFFLTPLPFLFFIWAPTSPSTFHHVEQSQSRPHWSIIFLVCCHFHFYPSCFMLHWIQGISCKSKAPSRAIVFVSCQKINFHRKPVCVCSGSLCINNSLVFFLIAIAVTLPSECRETGEDGERMKKVDSER